VPAAPHSVLAPVAVAAVDIGPPDRFLAAPELSALSPSSGERRTPRKLLPQPHPPAAKSYSGRAYRHLRIRIGKCRRAIASQSQPGFVHPSCARRSHSKLSPATKRFLPALHQTSPGRDSSFGTFAHRSSRTPPNSDRPGGGLQSSPAIVPWKFDGGSTLPVLAERRSPEYSHRPNTYTPA
jgi:hypothetical protein